MVCEHSIVADTGSLNVGISEELRVEGSGRDWVAERYSADWFELNWIGRVGGEGGIIVELDQVGDSSYVGIV